MVQTLIRLPFAGSTTVMQSVGGSYSHTGTSTYAYDFDLDFGTSVLAAAAGRVVSLRETVVDGGAYSYTGDPSIGTSGIGNYVTLEHQINGRTFYSSYFHLRNGSVPLRVGDVVEEGDVLGQVGNTGYRAGTHLHFQFGAVPITWTAGQVAYAGATLSNQGLAADLRFVGYDATTQLVKNAFVTGGVGGDLAANSGTDGMIPLFGHGTGAVGLARDMDWFRIEVQAGKTYTLTEITTAGALDPYLRLFDANGRLIGSDDDSGPGKSAQLSFVANATTHMFVAAGGYGSTTGSYDVGYAIRGVSRTGGFGADSLVGGDGADTIFGGAGRDSLRGYGYDDVISGDSGGDFLSGGNGRDTVDGGTGSDTLYGGAGADRFVFQQGDGVDSLRDFQNGLDRISLEGAGSYGALTFITASNGTWVDYGNGQVLLNGISRGLLNASDFLFT